MSQNVTNAIPELVPGDDSVAHGLGRDHVRGVGQSPMASPRIRLDCSSYRLMSGNIEDFFSVETKAILTQLQSS